MAGVTVSVSGPGDIGSELEALSEQLREIPTAIAEAVAPVAKRAILDHVAGARGGSLSLSGLGAALDVRATIDGGSDAAAARLEATPPGPWAIVDSGTRPHSIKAGARALNAMPLGVFAAVDHPGAHGLNVWDPACDDAERAADPVAEDVLDQLPGG